MPAPWLRAVALLVVLTGAPAFAQMNPEDAPVSEGQPKFTPPVLVERVPAPYPKAALDANLSGTVVLEFDVDNQGAVANVKVKTPSSHITYAYKFVLKIAPRPEPKKLDEVVRFSGGVFLRGTRAPVANGKVIAVGDAGTFQSDIDDKGHFSLKGLPPGKYHVIVNGPKARRHETNETIGEREVLTVNYYIEPSQYTRYESTVRADLNREEISRQVLTTEELVKMPGTFGDALRAIENLPGVARAPFNTGLIIVRGGRPTDSRVYIGGSEVPQLYHFGGLTSVVPTQVIDSIDFFAGNFGVRYGRAIAGTIDADLREGKRDRWHGAAETNVFDTGLSAEGPVGKGSLLLAARRSYVDALLSAVAAPGLKFTDAPVYYDYQAVFDYPVGGGHLRVMALGSDDVLKLIFDRPQDADPALTSFGTHIFFHKLQVRWTRAVGNWNFFTQLAGGYQGSSGALGSTLSYGVGVGGLDARLEGRYQWSRKLKFLIGADVVYSNVALDLDVPPPTREGQTPSPISAGETQHLHTPINLGEIGLFAEATWKPNGRVSITPGLRFDYYSVLQHPTVNPRLSAQFRLAGFTWLKAGVGLYSQPPQPTDYVAQFGSPTVRPESALHTALTLEQGLAPGLIVEATGFYKQLYDLAATSGKFVERGGQVVPERVASIGEGRVYGLEVLLRQSISKWFFGLVSYTLMKSERKDCSTCGWRQFDFDQTHVLVIVAHAYLPRGFELGLRFRYITGFPYTPPSGGYYDADSDVYSPAHGPVNTARLADFNAIDFRIDKTFLFKRWLLKLYLDVSNVYNRANQEVIQPSYDFVRSAPITGLPILPSFGIRGEF